MIQIQTQLKPERNAFFLVASSREEKNETLSSVDHFNRTTNSRSN
jgi:hypothetical protein